MKHLFHSFILILFCMTSLSAQDNAELEQRINRL